MDYNNPYSLKTLEDLEVLLNLDGSINQTVHLNGNLSSLAHVRKIYGDLHINDKLEDLGDLNYIQGNLSSHNEDSMLLSLGKLEQVDGDINLRYSNISSLGELKKVGGRLVLRDTNIMDLGKLEFIGGDLFLPIKLKDITLNQIEIKGKVRYWNNIGEAKYSKLTMNDNWLVNDYFSTIHHKEMEFNKRFLTGEYLVKKCFKLNELNNYIIDNINDYFSFVDDKLIMLYGDKNSFFEFLFDEIKTIKEINSEFPQINTDKRNTNYWEDANRLAKLKLNELKNEYPFIRYDTTLKKIKKRYNFKGYTSKYLLRYNEHKLMLCENTGTSKTSFIYYVENSILEIFSVLIHSLQNEFRVSRGLPKIGEGWISETDLYYKLKKHFKSVNIIHHGKPKWLGRQHVDIWLPAHNIGIEYQGQQHDRPVEYFGGELSFEENRKRDERKRILFKENNAILIEVREGFDFEKLCIEIQNYF